MDSNEIILAGYFFVVGILVTSIGTIISNYLTHKNRLEYRKRELILTWKREEFMRVVKALNKKLDHWEDLYQIIFHRKDYDKKQILTRIDNEILKDKIKFGEDFLDFKKDMLETLAKFDAIELKLGLLVKLILNEKKVNESNFLTDLTELGFIKTHIMTLMKEELTI